ncbi:nucleotide exchange factor GrpE [Candidatus Daviesbacteria bacterium]|nr:nucleotide exchange factor GrpE [Candidatus Daviesbacteria bacterium]
MTKKIDKVQELENKVNELEALLKRAVADYHNLEKRVQEGRSELTKWGTGELLVRILPTLDHLEQALGGASEVDKQSGWFRGVELAVKEFKGVLQSEGLEEVPTGGAFNPALHEAVDIQQGDDNIILKVVRCGYTLNGKVLRPAGVVVGRNVIASEAKQSGSEEGEMSS